MKERVWRVYYFKGQSQQKQMEHAGIERTTLMCVSERSNLRASMFNALSMAFYVCLAAIEHRRRTAATESVSFVDFGHTIRDRIFQMALLIH